MNKLTVGITVKILPGPEYGGDYAGKIGVVKNTVNARDGNRCGVEFPDVKNDASGKGLFWFSVLNVEPLHPLDYAALPDSMKENVTAISRRCRRGEILPFPDVKRVIYSGPKTIILWADGTKTIVSCRDGEIYDHYTGFCAAVVKKLFGSTSHAKVVLGKTIHIQGE